MYLPQNIVKVQASLCQVYSRDMTVNEESKYHIYWIKKI